MFMLLARKINRVETLQTLCSREGAKQFSTLVLRPWNDEEVN